MLRDFPFPVPTPNQETLFLSSMPDHPFLWNQKPLVFVCDDLGPSSLPCLLQPALNPFIGPLPFFLNHARPVPYAVYHWMPRLLLSQSLFSSVFYSLSESFPQMRNIVRSLLAYKPPWRFEGPFTTFLLVLPSLTKSPEKCSRLIPLEIR